MHVGIVNWSLYRTRGGLERVANMLAEAMRLRGDDVSIFYQTSRDTGKGPSYPLPEGARIIGLAIDEYGPDLEAARRAVCESGIDILVPMFSWGDLVWFPWLLQGSGIPMLVSEHSSPENVVRKWSRTERTACMDLADHIHVLTESAAATFPPDMRSRLSVIPNAAKFEDDTPREKVKPEKKILLGLGRLEEKPKQFSLLIKAFALIAPSFPDWDLRLCGDGKSYKDYIALVNELGLAERVQFSGMVTNVAAEYTAARLFCIPSKFEGFPTVCIEAQHFGVPIVAFADCPGVNEIVIHGENGLLADEMTADSLAKSLSALMRDETLSKKLGERGKKLLNRYEPGRVFDQWEKVLERVIASGQPTRLELAGKGLAGGPESRELLNRAHPLDRRAYIQQYRRARRERAPSPFTENEIARFIRQMQRCCIPGYRLSSKCLKSKLFRLVKTVNRMKC